MSKLKREVSKMAIPLTILTFNITTRIGPGCRLPRPHPNPLLDQHGAPRPLRDPQVPLEWTGYRPYASCLLHGPCSGLLLEQAYHSPLSGISCLLHGLCRSILLGPVYYSPWSCIYSAWCRLPLLPAFCCLLRAHPLSQAPPSLPYRVPLCRYLQTYQ